jgi:hypothetical protein
MKRKLIGAAILCIACAAPQLLHSEQSTGPVPDAAPVQRPSVTFNEQFIQSLSVPLNLKDPMAVFDLVFSSLDDEVIVYPTENYYYFSFNTKGKTISGNLRLDASDRDRGIMHMGYFEYDENGTYEDTNGIGKDLTSKQGVVIQRAAPLIYSVTYRGKTVRFHLNDIGNDVPRKIRLRKNEVFVGPVFDESGLKFFLLFNKPHKYFMYVLNDEGRVPETFVAVGRDVLVGRRTGYAFFSDTANARKILVGAHGRSVERNNWYDGPFDQLPDNYVARTRIRSYIEQAYPYLRGKVDKYGGYTSDKGSRALIFSYLMYYDIKEVKQLVHSSRTSRLTKDEFYAAITPDPSR